MKVSRGRIADRPWGVTLGALGARKVSGQLDLVTDDLRAYSIGFANGNVIAARAPDTHELDTTGMRPQQITVARARALVQAVALSFEATTGDFTFDDTCDLPAEPPIDVREAIYIGAKTYLANDRLAADLASLGERFTLKSSVTEAELEAYGLADAIEPIAGVLRRGATLAELEAAATDSEPSDVHAMIYALVSGGACEMARAQQIEGASMPLARVTTREHPAVGRATTPREIATARTQTPNRDNIYPRAQTPNRDVATPRTQTPNRDIATPRTQTPNRDVVFPPERARTQPNQRDVVYARPRTQPGAVRTAAPRSEAEAALASRQALIDQGADHFALLGLVFDAPIEAVRAAYFNLSRLLHPDRLAEIEMGDDPRGPRVFGRINAAFNTLTSPTRRAEYIESLRGPSDDAGAQEHFRRAEAALARDHADDALPELDAALELRPDNLDYLAARAWARFCVATDRDAIADETRETLSKAAQRADDPVAANLYLGRVERLLGRDRHALMHFEAVVALSPGHEDALSEIRMIERRLVDQDRRR